MAGREVTKKAYTYYRCIHTVILRCRNWIELRANSIKVYTQNSK